MLQFSPIESPHHPGAMRPVQPIKTLVLEDSLFDQRRLERMVQNSGFSMTLDFAPSLATLSTRLDQSQFDMVFLDFKLPIGTGCDALDIIKMHEVNNNCGTLMLAGSGGSDEDRQQLRQNCDFSLSKEKLTPDLLRTAVLDILSGLTAQKPMQSKPARATISIEEDIEAMIRDLRYLRVSTRHTTAEASAQYDKLEQIAVQTWTKLRQTSNCRSLDDRFDLLDLSENSQIQMH